MSMESKYVEQQAQVTQSLASLVQMPLPKKGETQERRSLLNEIYAFYDTKAQDDLRRIENWRKYVRGCKRAGIKPTSKDFTENFKKSRLYIKHIEKNRIWFFVCHVKTKDLYYVRSVCHDKMNRGESVGGYLGSLVKNV